MHYAPIGRSTPQPRATGEVVLGETRQRRRVTDGPEIFGARQVTHCGDEVRQGKPAPECFHAAAAKLGVAPADCLVIEDAPSGVQART